MFFRWQLSATAWCFMLVVASARPAEVVTRALSLSPDEQTILERTNKARAEHHLRPLTVDGTLLGVARAHSANMARHDEMAHKLDGKTPDRRVSDAGYNYRSMGENVAYGYGPHTVADIFDGWMKSPHHRENILNGKFRELGVGVARNEKGKIYYTQVFGTRQSSR